MAVLFSAVTLTADNNQVEFLAAGIPRDSDDLEGWTAYENFMDELDSEQEVSVHVEAYLYLRDHSMTCVSWNYPRSFAAISTTGTRTLWAAS